MKKSLKIFLIIALAGIVTGLSTIYYIFHIPHRNIESEMPTYTMKAKSLFDEYKKDESASNQKFGDNVLQVTGEIAEISADGYQISITLVDEMEGINCVLDSLTIAPNKSIIKALKVGDTITLKGKCDGFDMIMGVVLTRCFIINKSNKP